MARRTHLYHCGLINYNNRNILQLWSNMDPMFRQFLDDVHAEYDEYFRNINGSSRSTSGENIRRELKNNGPEHDVSERESDINGHRRNGQPEASATASHRNGFDSNGHTMPTSANHNRNGLKGQNSSALYMDDGAGRNQQEAKASSSSGEEDRKKSRDHFHRSRDGANYQVFIPFRQKTHSNGSSLISSS